MTVDEIIRDWLRSHGYDGLYQDDGECACLFIDLRFCEDGGGTCKAGVLGRCNPETCANGGCHTWHIVERGHPDQMSDDENKAFFADLLKKEGIHP